MKKISLLICSIFLLTGCTAEYNLNYENNQFKESLNIIGSKTETFEGQTFTTLINQYNNHTLLVNYKLDLGDMSIEDCENCKLYNKNIIDKDGLYGLNINYIYGEKSEFTNSSIMHTLFEKNYITDTYINVSECQNIFDYYTNLSEIKVIFKTDKEILEINSDQEIDGKYYWYINKDNYKDKKISIKFGNKEGIVTEDGYLSGNIIKYVLMALAIIILISIVVIYEKVKNSNKE